MSEREEFDAWFRKEQSKDYFWDYVSAFAAWQGARATQAVPALTDEEIFEIVGQVLGQPLIADDLREGFSVHTEPRDWLNFARAILAAPQPKEKGK